MVKGPEQILLQGGHTEGSETYERMLSITSHQRDANAIPLHTGQNGHHKQINKQVRVRLWGKGNPRPLLGMQTGAATVENTMKFPHKTENGTAF